MVQGWFPLQPSVEFPHVKHTHGKIFVIFYVSSPIPLEKIIRTFGLNFSGARSDDFLNWTSFSILDSIQTGDLMLVGDDTSNALRTQNISNGPFSHAGIFFRYDGELYIWESTLQDDGCIDFFLPGTEGTGISIWKAKDRLSVCHGQAIFHVPLTDSFDSEEEDSFVSLLFKMHHDRVLFPTFSDIIEWKNSKPRNLTHSKSAIHCSQAVTTVFQEMHMVPYEVQASTFLPFDLTKLPIFELNKISLLRYSVKKVPNSIPESLVIEKIQSAFQHNYVHNKEALQEVQDKGFGFAPYNLAFLITKYPFLFIKAGEGSQRNLQIINGPDSMCFTPGEIPKDAVRIVALGDLMPLQEGEFISLHPKLSSILDQAHIVLINVESPVIGKKSVDPSNKTTLNFDMSKDFVFLTLREFHVGNNAVFSVANNHAGDSGPEGLKQTVNNLSTLGLVVGAHEKVGGYAGMILKIQTHQGIVRIFCHKIQIF